MKKGGSNWKRARAGHSRKLKIFEPIDEFENGGCRPLDKVRDLLKEPPQLLSCSIANGIVCSQPAMNVGNGSWLRVQLPIEQCLIDGHGITGPRPLVGIGIEIDELVVQASISTRRVGAKAFQEGRRSLERLTLAIVVRVKR